LHALERMMCRKHSLDRCCAGRRPAKERVDALTHFRRPQSHGMLAKHEVDRLQYVALAWPSFGHDDLVRSEAPSSSGQSIAHLTQYGGELRVR
jgi:hypothetical protein